MQNPLGSYRRTQRELRRNFEAFTRANCPDCPTPCCRRPARIAPTDILLAESTGWRSVTPLPLLDAEPGDSAQDAASADMVTASATRMLDALHSPQSEQKEGGQAQPAEDAHQNAGGALEPQASKPQAATNNHAEQTEGKELEEAENASLPCEFLGVDGCTFPTDLRPFGCTTYICKYMYARMDRATLTRIKRLARELEDKHTILLRAARRAGLASESDE